VAASKRKDWKLTESAFRGLLAFLDPDPQSAPHAYERVREKLTRFFEWRGCTPGEDFADETIDRVARRLEQGLESRPENPYLYFHGVALNVVREHWRQREASGSVAPLQTRFVQPFEAEQRESGEIEAERRSGCLADCLDRLTPASRELLLAYHLGGRKGLTLQMNIGSAALRLRVFRIRRQMERCLRECLETSARNTH
jgi:DNA-directed RNA polymerase specialized sigma24 family protein